MAAYRLPTTGNLGAVAAVAATQHQRANVRKASTVQLVPSGAFLGLIVVPVTIQTTSVWRRLTVTATTILQLEMESFECIGIQRR